MTTPKDPENFNVMRGRSLTRSQYHVTSSLAYINLIEGCGSFSTNATIPRSWSPSSRTSLSAADVQTADNMYLESPLLCTNELSEYPEVRCVVTSMPFTNSNLGLSGFYSGMMDVAAKLPDGKGIVCCHDGTIIDGEWQLGEIQAFFPAQTKRHSDSDYSYQCDISSCSSLSASVARRAFRDVDEAKKFKIPRNLFLVQYSHESFGSESSKIMRAHRKRTGSRGSASEQTEKTFLLSWRGSIYNGQRDQEGKKASKPFGLLSKVKFSVNAMCRRV